LSRLGVSANYEIAWSSDVLRDLLLLIADQPDGFDVALEILFHASILIAPTAKNRAELLRLAGATSHVPKRTSRGDHKLRSRSLPYRPDAVQIAAELAVG